MTDDSLTPTKRFWRLIKPDSKEIRNIHAYAIFNGLISLSLPLGIQSIINLIQGGQISTSWIVLVVLVVCGIGISGVLQIYQLRISENIQQKIFTRAAFEFTYRIPRIKMEALYKHYAPELMNRFFDIVSIQKGLSKILIDLSTTTFAILFSMILLSFYHPFFIIFSFLLVTVIAIIVRFVAQRGMNTSLKESIFKYKVAHWLEELSRTYSTFKLAGLSDLPLKQTDQYVGKYLTAREDHFKALVQQYYLMVGFKILVAAGLLGIGGMLVINQQMNIGQFVAAEIIILVVLHNIEKLITNIESIYDILTSLEKVGYVTDMELERQTGVELVDYKKGIELEFTNVSFNYPNAKRKILNDVSFVINSGERCVITGANGSGKSSMLKIMAGLYDMQEGVISYNGMVIGNLSLDSLRAAIGDQISMERLFEASVLDNITLGKESTSFENVQWAVENLGLTEFIKSLPEGYNTVLNAQGTKLPENIVVKLLLARSIANKPKLLLLENTFEQLDDKECHRIIDFLTAPENQWTLIAVSSNEYLSKCSTKIIELAEGKVAKIESRDETLNNNNSNNNLHA